MSSSVEMGDFLRSRRLKLDPEALGLPSRMRRRTSGLRREEVAERAGISTDWYIQLEQGRAVVPSSRTVEGLASALELDAQDRAHLRALAGHALSLEFVRETVPAAVRTIVASLVQPAYVTGRRWDLLAWNAASVELFGDFDELPVAERNLLYFVFTNAGARRLFGDGWWHVARSMLAQFRVTHDLLAADPGFADLVCQLRRDSANFAEWWVSHDVGHPVAGRKTLHHPTRGTLRFDHASFQANDNPALKLVVYTPVV